MIEYGNDLGKYLGVNTTNDERDILQQKCINEITRMTKIVLEYINSEYKINSKDLSVDAHNGKVSFYYNEPKSSILLIELYYKFELKSLEIDCQFDLKTYNGYTLNNEYFEKRIK